MRIFLRLFYYLFMSFGFNALGANFGWCPEGHCLTVDPEVNSFCVENNLNRMLLTHPSGAGKCYCPCSCVSSETRISMAGNSDTLAIKQLAIGFSVFSPFSIDQEAKIDNVVSTNYADLPAQENNIFSLTFSNNKKLVASKDHTFVDGEGNIISAEELNHGSSVVDANNYKIQLVEKNFLQSFKGKMMNLILNKNLNFARNHLYVTNEIISGDLFVQSAYNSIQNEIDIRISELGL